MTAAAKPAERKKRTITEIRDSKQQPARRWSTRRCSTTPRPSGRKRRASTSCVVGDSLAMTCHGHPSTIPATMDMMVLHVAGGAARRAQHLRARVHALPELQHGRPRARERDALHAGGARRRGQAAGRQVAGAHPQGARGRGHSHRVAHRAHAAHHRDVRRLQDPGPHRRGGDEDPRGRARDPGRGLLHARVRGGAGEDREGDLGAARDPDHRHRRRRRHRRADPALPTTCSACSPTSSRSSPSATRT